jgi:hypothetical protein
MVMYDILGALDALFEEVHYMDFYRDIFPVGSFEERGEYEDGKYNGIAIAIEKGSKRAKRRTITDDLDTIADMAGSNDFCLMSPISYAGKSRKSSNARFMYALAIDLDGMTERKHWDFFMEQINRGHEMLQFVWGLPRPTYLVSSGSGIHIYYVFKQPIPMFKNIVEELEKLKRRLTWQAWTQGASSLHDKVQYESLFQGFRVVGTITKDGGRCRAFSVGEKVTVEYLNKFVPEDHRAVSFVYKSDLLLQDAKKKYPEWYQRRIVEKRPRNTWTCKKAVYDWWIRKLKEGAEQGHRYWCIMTLATYAQKCGVPRETLEEDAYGLIPFMNTKGDEFTEDDVMHALEAYTDSYVTYPIDTIVWRTGIQIEKNKRNFRKQALHLERARAVQNIDYPCGEWRNKEGRPDKLSVVAEWRSEHPEGTKAECIRETGLSKKTVYRWWREIDLMELREYTNKEKMVQLSGDESQRKAAEIVAAVTAIAQERGLSEEEAYEVFLHGKTRKEQVQEQAKHMVFAESEVDAGLLVGCAANGIREINVMPDDEYMNYLATDCVNALFPPNNRK